MPEHFLSSPLLYSLALTLIHFIWQGVVVALALKSVLIFITNNKPQLRYALSALAMLCNLFIPIITFFVIYQPDQLPLLANVQSSDPQQVLPSSTNVNNVLWSQGLVEYLPYLSIAWLTTITVLASKLFFEIYAVNQLSSHAAKPAIGALQARFNDLVAKLAINSSPKLLISLKVSVPMAIGWLKPMVLLPAAMVSGLTPTQLDMLILHELAHIRRHDYFVNFVQTLVELLLFFHPAVLWVSNQMRNEREYCSDDIAVQHSGDPIAYAHTLADTASLCRHIDKSRKHSIPSMAMAASGGDLKQRVIRLVDQHHCSSSQNSGKWLASIVIIFAVMMLSLKQFMAFPIFELNSATFTLYNAASNTAKNLANTSTALIVTGLSETPVAKQLLTQSVMNKSSSSFPARNSAKETPMVRFSAELVEDNQFKAFPDSVKKYAYTPQKNTYDLPQEKTAILNGDVKLLALNVKESTLRTAPKTSNKKSMSELAFERTDPQNVNTQTGNPYTEQIKALAEPFESRLGDLLNKAALSESSNIAETQIVEQVNNVSVNHGAKLVSSVQPKYPSTAKRKGIELDVMVHFTISITGRVKDIQFESRNKISYFRSAIRHAMKKWRFTPAEIDGKAVESKMSKLFSFSLK